jgi:hypothetical protein
MVYKMLVLKKAQFYFILNLTLFKTIKKLGAKLPQWASDITTCQICDQWLGCVQYLGQEIQLQSNNYIRSSVKNGPMGLYYWIFVAFF